MPSSSSGSAESFPTVFCHNFSATGPPVATDDVTLGYRKGSKWVDGVNQKTWGYVGGGVGTAVWVLEGDTGEALEPPGGGGAVNPQISLIQWPSFNTAPAKL